MMWDDFLPLGQALEERFPETDVLSVSDAELARMLRALPMTDGAGKMPESADFFYQVNRTRRYIHGSGFVIFI